MNEVKKYGMENEEVYGVVYKITNIINRKVYIGVSTLVDEGTENAFINRYNNNILNTHNEHLKNSMNKYGIENFEVNPVLDVAYSQEELDELEDIYISIQEYEPKIWL